MATRESLVEFERKLEDVVETLENSREAKRGCSLLIGAGCSKSAGVPLASEIVALIKDKYPKAYERAAEKTYAACMGQLAPGERTDLLRQRIDEARLNWGHVAIAQLLKAGWVDRVLTTNFDPLVLKACSLVDQHPAVYDFAVSQLFKPSYLPPKAVFHLHGQHMGMVLLNTEQEVERYRDKVAPLFEDAGRGRAWIVVGYSGENDPVFEHLSRVECFDHKLYWVSYLDSSPGAHVSEKLLVSEKYAFLVRGYDADRFLVELARALGCFPPDFVAQPFTYLQGRLESLAPFTLESSGAPDLLTATRQRISKAIDHFELASGKLSASEMMAVSLLMAGNSVALVELSEHWRESERKELSTILGWAHMEAGTDLLEQAERATALDFESLLRKSVDFFERALRVSPDLHEALYKWGLALELWADRQRGAEADRLSGEACARFADVLRIKPEHAEALFNWGLVLAKWSDRKRGAEADRLSVEACVRFEEIHRIKPEHAEALFNWGLVLAKWSERKRGASADRLSAEACARYKNALQIRPGDPEALLGWAVALEKWAGRKQGAKADRLSADACARFEDVVRIRPNDPEAHFGWAFVLTRWATRKQGAEADRLSAEACSRFEEALRIKPDKYEAHYHWGFALARWAERKQGEEAERLSAEACARFEEALRIKPDFHQALEELASELSSRAYRAKGKKRQMILKKLEDVLKRSEGLSPGSEAYNLACVSGLRRRASDCRNWLEVARSTGNLPAKDVLDVESDLDSMRNQRWFQGFMASL
jgi:cytochrome c-type biogenesis protein CcmH/NrfG